MEVLGESLYSPETSFWNLDVVFIDSSSQIIKNKYECFPESIFSWTNHSCMADSVRMFDNEDTLFSFPLAKLSLTLKGSLQDFRPSWSVFFGSGHSQVFLPGGNNFPEYILTLHVRGFTKNLSYSFFSVFSSCLTPLAATEYLLSIL